MTNLHFNLRYHTEFGQTLWITGNTEELGNDNTALALPMTYLNDQSWQASITFRRKDWPGEGVNYRYFLRNRENEIIAEWGRDRIVQVPGKEITDVYLHDTWNHAGEYENAFFTAPFNNVLLKPNHPSSKKHGAKHYTHIFRVKAPLLAKHEVVTLAGSDPAMGNWAETDNITLFKEADWWTAYLDLSHANFPLSYKYGVFHQKEERFIKFEDGDNRTIPDAQVKESMTVVHDGFIHLPNNTWKGAGVSIPVFSLRTKSGFGVGEFTDLKWLVDWANETNLKLIQILPVNDTIATHTWVDSYPYAAISAFALHPLYINLETCAGKKHADILGSLKKKHKQLNQLEDVDYEEVTRFKLEMLKELYELRQDDLDSGDYKEFFSSNKHWLVPYAAFCYFRDLYGTTHFKEWDSNSVYDKAQIDALLSGDSPFKKEINFYCFVQYHLHLQLKSAADYAHKHGVVLKGDIPIGIYRYGCDAWVNPSLYNMDEQAGAPPDDFTAIGQNWEFPTYNWKKMQEDDFSWWKQRFEQMSNYFDTFRIDHILGFFRIWSVPSNAVQGVMGHFVPCIPVHYVEFGENGIWLDEPRFCQPFITDDVIAEIFGDLSEKVKQVFVEPNQRGGYDLKAGFRTQRDVEAGFEKLEDSAENLRLKLGLYDLISNVILLKQDGSRGQEFHFRIDMEKTLSFKYLIPHVQERLRSLYVNYFYRRQDDFWRKEAMQKLPKLKESTNMLICGEDLGMVPDCVPDVMKRLGILSLEIQRMPKDPTKEFFYPWEAPYLSVITPSTHDMSTVRGWWEENRERTQHFYNHVLGQWGDAPYFCEAWVSRAIILQHLYSPAMWSIFKMQDLLGMNEKLRRKDPHTERINNPANPKHYWRYRMHIPLEELTKEKEFNKELADYVRHSGR